MPKRELFFKPSTASQGIISAIKIYQKEIENQKERKKKLEVLLKKNISSACRKRAYNRVQSLEVEITHHQKELAKILKWKRQ